MRRDRPAPGRTELDAAAVAALERLAVSHALLQRLSRSGLGAGVPTDRSHRTFRDLLARRGLREALATVVGLSDYRYGAVFRFRDGKAAPVVFVDRQDPGATGPGEVPDEQTYCCYVRAEGQPFATADAPADPATVGHPARDRYAAYAGIPIPVAGDDAVFCHFDVVPRDPTALDNALLARVVSDLAAHGVPPFPVSARSRG